MDVTPSPAPIGGVVINGDGHTCGVFAYRDLCIDAGLVVETGFWRSGQVHVRLVGTGALLCGEPTKRVEFLAELPLLHADLPPDLHAGCLSLVPE
jgi:hypothetical protein